MTQQEIIEGNELIASFLGFQRSGPWWNLPIMFPHNLLTDRYTKAMACNSSLLSFHESWDWLMPVVEKIEALEDFDEFRIETNQVVVKAMGFYKIIQFGEVFHAEFKTKIETVWSGCSQFIKWYNEQSK